jgi:hypothetical protein
VRLWSDGVKAIKLTKARGVVPLLRLKPHHSASGGSSGLRF